MPFTRLLVVGEQTLAQLPSCLCSFFDVLENTSSVCSSAGHNDNLPLVPLLVDVPIAGGRPAFEVLIPKTPLHDAEILPPVVQSVSVDVVHFHPFRGLGEKAVHELPTTTPDVSVRSQRPLSSSNEVKVLRRDPGGCLLLPFEIKKEHEGTLVRKDFNPVAPDGPEVLTFPLLSAVDSAESLCGMATRASWEGAALTGSSLSERYKLLSTSLLAVVARTQSVCGYRLHAGPEATQSRFSSFPLPSGQGTSAFHGGLHAAA